jgi:hypothetical protein
MPIKAAWFVPAHLIRATTFSTGQHILRLENAGPENAAMHMVKNCLTPSLVGARPAATSGNAAGRQRPEAFNSGHTQRARSLSSWGRCRPRLVAAQDVRQDSDPSIEPHQTADQDRTSG